MHSNISGPTWLETVVAEVGRVVDFDVENLPSPTNDVLSEVLPRVIWRAAAS
jgi:hypothetical protein